MFKERWLWTFQLWLILFFMYLSLNKLMFITKSSQRKGECDRTYDWWSGCTFFELKRNFLVEWQIKIFFENNGKSNSNYGK